MLNEIVILDSVIEMRYDDITEYKSIGGHLDIMLIKRLAKYNTCPIKVVSQHSEYYNKIIRITRGLSQGGLISDDASRQRDRYRRDNIPVSRCVLPSGHSFKGE